jgi:hypothetical protein
MNGGKEKMLRKHQARVQAESREEEDNQRMFGIRLNGGKVVGFCTRNGRSCDFLVHDSNGQARCANKKDQTRPLVGLIIEQNRLKRNVKSGDGNYCEGHGF